MVSRKTLLNSAAIDEERKGMGDSSNSIVSSLAETRGLARTA